MNQVKSITQMLITSLLPIINQRDIGGDDFLVTVIPFTDEHGEHYSTSAISAILSVTVPIEPTPDFNFKPTHAQINIKYDFSGCEYDQKTQSWQATFLRWITDYTDDDQDNILWGSSANPESFSSGQEYGISSTDESTILHETISMFTYGDEGKDIERAAGLKVFDLASQQLTAMFSKDTLRKQLIESLVCALKPAISLNTLKSLCEGASYRYASEVVGNKFDVAVRLSAAAAFSPEFEGNNQAKISFDVVLEDCHFNHDEKRFEWDGKSIGVEYNYEYNLMLAHAKHTNDVQPKDWVLQVFEQNFPDDKKVSFNVLDKIFGALTAREFQQFGLDTYKNIRDGEMLKDA